MIVIICDNLVGGFNPSEKYQSVGKDTISIYMEKWKMFETTNQFNSVVPPN